MTEKQLKQLAHARSCRKNKPCSEETKLKISKANNGNFYETCDYCGNKYHAKKSHHNRSKRHFCSRQCYSKYRAEIMSKEEQNSYGTGFPIEERKRRKDARTKLNHYLRDKHIKRKPCEVCGNPKTEAHHDDYEKPFEIRWLCFKCHRKLHKANENPELLEETK